MTIITCISNTFKKIIVSSDNVATNPWPGSKLLGCIVVDFKQYM